MPCIYRRAALHTISLDNETYGRDICAGDVNVNINRKLQNDFRALLSFLKHNYSTKQISSLLLSNGRLNVSELENYAGTVHRAMNEIRALLREKGSDEVKSWAGLDGEEELA